MQVDSNIMFDLVAPSVGWGVLPAGVSGRGPPLGPAGLLTWFPSFGGMDGGDHAFGQERHSYLYAYSTFYA